MSRTPEQEVLEAVQMRMRGSKFGIQRHMLLPGGQALDAYVMESLPPQVVDVFVHKNGFLFPSDDENSFGRMISIAAPSIDDVAFLTFLFESTIAPFRTTVIQSEVGLRRRSSNRDIPFRAPGRYGNRFEALIDNLSTTRLERWSISQDHLFAREDLGPGSRSAYGPLLVM